MSDQVQIVEVGPERAADVLAMIHAAFAGRPDLDPPATAMDETAESVAAALGYGGLLATDADGQVLGGLLLADLGRLIGVRRFGVLPPARGSGLASRLATAVDDVARARGKVGIQLEARAELPATVRFWERHGYHAVAADGPRLRMLRILPRTHQLPTAEDTQAAGCRLGALLHAGDVVVLDGDLGAGKTTLTQGLGEAMGVRGPITSPTFVIAREHPSLSGGPGLVHVDAYRLGDAAELDDLDLDASIEDSVTVIEWGAGLADVLSRDRLELRLERAADDVRTLTITPVGAHWETVDFDAAGL